MPVSDQDLRALTYIARRLREDTQGCGQWDEAGTFSSFKTALANQNLLIATQRVLAHATDPEAKTPGAIKRPFTPEPTNAPARIPFDPRAVCHVCAKHQHPPTDHPFVSVEAKRAAVPAPRPKTLHVVTDDLCTHGVRPLNCLEHAAAARAEIRKNATAEETAT